MITDEQIKALNAIEKGDANVNDAPPKARQGAWTPWAAVLCVECEYTDLKSGKHGDFYARRLKVVTWMSSRTEEIEQPKGELLGTCTSCMCKCWVRDDVALLQQVGFKSSDLDWEGPYSWALQQTGGMCAALVFSTEGRQIVVTAMDGSFYVGEYAHTDGEEDSWDHPLRTWESASLYEDDAMKSAPVLEVMVGECASKAIEFIRNPVVAPSSETSARLECGGIPREADGPTPSLADSIAEGRRLVEAFNAGRLSALVVAGLVPTLLDQLEGLLRGDRIS